jgi:tubulin beta
MNERELTHSLFDPKSFICEGNPKYGKFLTGSLLYRGEKVSGGEVDSQLTALNDKNSGMFVEWIPNRLMTSICSVCPPYKTSSMSGTSLFNSTTISQTLSRINDSFQAMYRKRAFVH